ncbi:MAG: tRNA (N6-threonylcarbamoyladenosine(37)-N6)-methyltransferase TrmO [Desulfobacterales bacterium]|nr:tRNA (N6-threonylcarbamoyladenosine(37)-N6)-methyltransferase TrmO [Desulfobacterales bacterium]
MKPIGYAHTREKKVPRHWSVSESVGFLEIDETYVDGLRDIRPGNKIVVIFYFHQSPAFENRYLTQTPPHHGEERGVFSTCSPRRPNPIGFSVLKVVEKDRNRIVVKGIDMIDGTPILDIKPFIESN